MPWTPTPTPAEPPTIIDAGGQPVVVEQGPAWLAGLLYGPPWWVVWALGAVLGLVGLVVVYRARRVEDRSRWATLAGQSAERLALVCCIGLATQLSTDLFALPYLGDVLVGLAVGYGSGRMLGRAVGELLEQELLDTWGVRTDG